MVSGKSFFIKIVVFPYIFAFLLLFCCVGILNNSLIFQNIVFPIIVFVLIFPYLIWLIMINQFIKMVHKTNNDGKYIISIVYFIVYILFGPFIFQTYQGTELLKILFVFHFLAMISSAYVIFHIAKKICTIEYKREVKIADCIGTFVLLSLYPVGVFYIQKRLNKINTKNK